MSGPVLCAMNERLEGFAVCNLPSEAGAPCRKALFSADGGVLTGMHGEAKDADTGASLDVRWRWDPSKQRAGRPPRGPVTVPLCPAMTFVFAGRRSCSLRFAAGGVSVSFDLSERLRRPPGTAYTDLASTRRDSAGRRVPDTSGRVKMADRVAAVGNAAKARRMRNRPETSAFRSSALASIVSGLDEAMASVKRRGRGGESAPKPYVERGWREAARAQTLREAPRLLGLPTGTRRVAPGADALTAALIEGQPRRGGVARLDAGDVDAAIREAAERFESEAAGARSRLEAELGLTAGLGATGTLGGTGGVGGAARPGAGAGAAAGGGLSAEVEEAMARTWGPSLRRAAAGAGEGKDGYGSAAGASLCRGRWLSDVDTRKRLGGIHPSLPRTGGLVRASGRYSDVVSAPSRPSAAIPDAPPGADAEPWLADRGAAFPDSLLVVLCLRTDDSTGRAAMQTVGRLQSTLATHFPFAADFASDPLVTEDERTALAAEAAQAGARGVGPDGRESPLHLRLCRTEAGGWLARRFSVRSLPLFLAFWRGALVYRGVMGGSRVVRLPACNRPCNVLMVEPSAALQVRAERTLRTGRWSWVLVSGRYDAGRDAVTAGSAAGEPVRGGAGLGPGGGVVGLADEAAARLREVRDAAKEADRRCGAGSTGRAASGPGLDTTAQRADDFALVLVAAKAGEAEAGRIAGEVARSGGTGRGGAVGSEGGVSPRLCGRSLVVAVLPSGAVLPGPGPAVLPVAASSRSASSAAPRGEAWSCPRTGVVVGPSDDHLLGGAATVAVVRPLREATMRALRGMWRQCLHARGEASGRARAAAAAESKSRGDGGAPGAVLLPGQTSGPEGEGDGAHLGMTHNDLLARLMTLRQDASAGRARASTAAVLLPASETVIRGTRLIASTA